MEYIPNDISIGYDAVNAAVLLLSSCMCEKCGRGLKGRYSVHHRLGRNFVGVLVSIGGFTVSTII